MKVKTFILVCSFIFLISGLTGCEAFVRKFTRKPKEIHKEEPVIEPQAYPDIGATKDALYKDYFLFWETWAEELLSFLRVDSNFKKQKECAWQALDNLTKMQSLLNEDKAKQLEKYIVDFTKIKDDIYSGRLIYADLYSIRLKVDNIKSGVHRSFVFSKVKNDFK